MESIQRSVSFEKFTIKSGRLNWMRYTTLNSPTKSANMYFFFLFETVIKPRIRTTNPGKTFDPFIPPLKTHMIVIPTMDIKIIGKIKGSNMPFTRMK